MKSKFLLLFLSVILFPGCFKDEVRNLSYTMEFEIKKEKEIANNADLLRLTNEVDVTLKLLMDEYCEGQTKKYLNMVAQAPKKEIDGQVELSDKIALEKFELIEGVLKRTKERFDLDVAKLREQGKINENDRVYYTYKYIVKKKKELLKETVLFELAVNNQ